MIDLPPIPTRSSRNVPKPPRDLEKPERDLWRKLTAAFDFSDAASLSLLAVAMAAHKRMRLAQAAIQADGMTVLDRFGQKQRHPLLAVESSARTGYIAALRTMNCDLGIGSPK